MLLAADIAIAMLSLAIAGLLYRAISGPSMADRIVAIDTIAINLIGVIAVFSLKRGTLIFVDVMLLIAILGFIGTVALAKYLVGGAIFDRVRD